jgi:dienelactone hydrolase
MFEERSVPICMQQRRTILWATLLILVCPASAISVGPQVLPKGQVLDDWRREPLKDLNGYFPFTPAKSEQAWRERQERVRRQVKVALGLWPAPTTVPLEPVIHGKIDHVDYTVEKVYFQSLPGFYVAGNLYRPAGGKGKRPGILSPHGHYPNGRFCDYGPTKVKQLIESGDEVFENGGRSPLQSRCVTLARMGCVVFHYDMIGYADSRQLPFELVHRFSKQRPSANRAERWGFYSPQAESHLQSILGLQIWNGIRALDFLASLPDVDPQRLAVTGGSGGGTQSMLLGAIDPRPATIVPAVMVSTAMQGGCMCENSCLLRIGTGNVEFSALYAPKPQLLVAADDWTRELPTKGFPELQQHYTLLGAKSNIDLVANLRFKHNYNYVNRAAMYEWMNRRLGLGIDGQIVERDYERLADQQLSVWNEQHPRPASGESFERELLHWLTLDAQQQLDEVYPRDAASLKRYKSLVEPALDVVIGRALPDPRDIQFREVSESVDGDVRISAGLLSLKLNDQDNDAPGRKEQMPILFLKPREGRGQTIVWLSSSGKSGLFNDDGSVIEPVKKLLLAGCTVVGVDLLFQEESLEGETPLNKTRRVAEPDEAGAYTFGYNRALFARRVHDVLTVVSYVAGKRPGLERVVLMGWDAGSGPIVAAAARPAREALDRAVIHTHRFRFGKVSDLHSVDFLPGGAKYGDLPGMLAVAAPLPLYLTGEGPEGPKLVSDAYRAAGMADQLRVDADNDLDHSIEWLLRRNE